MCIACLEFIKGTLNSKEFKNALSETTRNNPEHLAEIERAIGKDSSDLDALRKKIKSIQPDTAK